MEFELNPTAWPTLFDSHGRMLFEYQFRKTVFTDGLTHELRPDAWKYLLGLYPCTSSLDERSTYITNSGEEYERLLQRAIFIYNTGNDKTFIQNKKIIDKDVARTDRDHPFFSGDDNTNLIALQNILLAHTLLDPELGYIQGMNDMAAPVLFVMKSELAAFWCFAALMKRMRNNFIDIALHQPLSSLKALVRYVDLPMHDHLSRCSPDPDGDWLFCHRWLLLDFKREFDLESILPLWERIWAQHSTSHFQIFVAVGILNIHREKIMAIQSPDELLGYLQNLAVGLDMQHVIQRGQDALEVLVRDTSLTPALQALITPAQGKDTFAPPPSVGFVRMRGSNKKSAVSGASGTVPLPPAVFPRTTPPTEAPQQQPPPIGQAVERGPPPTASVLAAPTSWAEYFTTDGTPYYHNPHTDQTRWSKP